MTNNLEIIAGDDLTLDLELRDSNNVLVADLVGAVAVMQVREDIFDSTLDAISTGIVTPANGTIQFTIPKEDTLLLLPVKESKKHYQYGCRVTYSDSTAITILQGKLTVIRGVVE